MNTSQLNTYRQVLRIAGTLLAVALWGASVALSNRGFGFDMPGWQWLGLLLSLAVLWLQLTFSREGWRIGLLLATVALAAYGYGIYTNTVGITLAQGLDPRVLAGAGQWGRLIFPAVLGVILEVLPEPMFLFCITGTFAGDLLSQLLYPAQVPTPPTSTPTPQARTNHRQRVP